MKPTTLENQIADQLFKITKSDDNFRDYMLDCSNDNSNIVLQRNIKDNN